MSRSPISFCGYTTTIHQRLGCSTRHGASSRGSYFSRLFHTLLGYVESCQCSRCRSSEVFRHSFVANAPALFAVRQTFYSFYYTSYTNTSYTSYTEGFDDIYGQLTLEIIQGSYSLTTVRDVDPLEIGTLLGNIGGFWGKNQRT